MELAGGGGDEDVVDVGEILAARERLPERGERVGDDAPGLLGEGTANSMALRVLFGQAVGPAEGHEAVLGGAPVDLPLVFLFGLGDSPRPPAALLPDAAEQDRLPDRNDGRPA